MRSWIRSRYFARRLRFGIGSSTLVLEGAQIRIYQELQRIQVHSSGFVKWGFKWQYTTKLCAPSKRINTVTFFVFHFRSTCIDTVVDIASCLEFAKGA